MATDDDGERPRNTEPDLDAGRSTLDDVDVPRGGTLPMGEPTAAPQSPGDEGDEGDEGDDGGEPVDEAEADPPAKPKTSAIVFVFVGLIFVALAGPVLFYFFVWRYKPTAPRHIPAGTNLAVRIDAKELYLFEPFRTNVLGVLEEQPGVKSRAARLKKATGIDPRTDLREIVVASPDGHRFVVLLGGYFTQARMNRVSVTKGLLEVLDEEGVSGFHLEGDVLMGPGGLEIAQAEDTTIVIASDDDMLKASLQPSDDWTSLGLVSSGAVSFAIEAPVFAHASSDLSALPGASLLAHTKRASGFLKLGASPELSAELVPDGVDSEAFAKETEAALADARLLGALLPDLFGEKAALAAARVKPRTSSVMVTAPWPKEGLAAGTKWFGDASRAVLEKK